MLLLSPVRLHNIYFFRPSDLTTTLPYIFKVALVLVYYLFELYYNKLTIISNDLINGYYLKHLSSLIPGNQIQNIYHPKLKSYSFLTLQSVKIVLVHLYLKINLILSKLNICALECQHISLIYGNLFAPIFCIEIYKCRNCTYFGAIQDKFSLYLVQICKFLIMMLNLVSNICTKVPKSTTSKAQFDFFRWN